MTRSHRMMRRRLAVGRPEILSVKRGGIELMPSAKRLFFRWVIAALSLSAIAAIIAAMWR
jgi:hypothetical protein